MPKFQCLLVVSQQSYICYYNICMTVPYSEISHYKRILLKNQNLKKNSPTQKGFHFHKTKILLLVGGFFPHKRFPVLCKGVFVYQVHVWYFQRCNDRFSIDIYLLKFNHKNTRTRCGICSKLTIKTPE